MNVKFTIIVSWLVSISYFSPGVASAEDFMDKSLDELGAIPVTLLRQERQNRFFSLLQ